MTVSSPEEQPIHLGEHSQRLRYEAFSHFSTQINQATNTDQVGLALARHTKYILDVFLLRIHHQYGEYATELEVSGGRFEVRERLQAESSGNLRSHQPENIRGLEEQLLADRLPLRLAGDELQAHGGLEGSLFRHPKAAHFFALPLVISDNHKLVLSIAGKASDPFGHTDFRLIRLTGELLAGKLAQLLLAGELERKNRGLSAVNTKLLALNEQVSGLNAVLEHRVEQRTTQLRKANQELSTIFYRTSHDFRRPLMTLLGLLNLAELTVEEASREFGAAAPAAPGKGLSFLPHLCSRGKTVIAELDSMLNKLSTLSWLEEADKAGETIDFEKLADELRVKFKADVDRCNIDFRVDLSVLLPYSGNAGIISVLLENLLENAIHFRSSDPVITLRIFTKEISAASYGENTDITSTGGRTAVDDGNDRLPAGKKHKLIMQVSDNGEGIDPAWQDKIFDLYVRASERSKGNGLGLYVVRRTAELLGGAVTVVSELYEGSTFSIELPC